MERLIQSQRAKNSTQLEKLISSNHELMRENERMQRQVTQLKALAGGGSLSPALDALDDDALDDETDEPGQDKPAQDDSHTGQIDESLGEIGNITASSTTSKRQLRRITTLEDEARAAEIESLRAELVTLQKSHSSLTATMQQLHAELRDVKSTNVDLREQNEAYIDLLQEKTLSGALINESAVLSRRYDEDTDQSRETTESEEGRTDEDDEYDDDEDDEEDEDDDDTEASGADKDDVDDVPDVPREKTKKQKERKRKGMTLKPRSSANLLNPPTSLANELEKTDEAGDAGGKRRERRRERSEALTTNVADLQREVWELRDANRGLTLYVSKILDRIIAREGYENILAADQEHKRSVRGTSSRLRGQRSRPSNLAAEFDSGRDKAAGTQQNQQKRQSGSGLLGFARAYSGSGEADTSTTATPTTARPRRGGSIDWRALIGASPAQSAAKDSSSLRPLALAGAAAPPTSRRISNSEEQEDEVDIEERERIRAALEREGLDLPDHQLKSPKSPNSQRQSTSIGTFFSRVISTASSNAADPPPSAPKTDAGQSQASVPTVAPHQTQPKASSRDRSASITSSTSSSLSRSEARQRALDANGAGASLTQAPARGSLSARHRSRREGSSSMLETGHGSVEGGNALHLDTSRSSSMAGDESYAQVSSPITSQSISSQDREAEGAAAQEEPGWRKALKRMSLLGGEYPSTTATQ